MLKGERIVLRPINENDIELLRSWRNKYSQDFFTQDFITKQQQKAWYEKYVESHGKDWMFLISLKDGTPIGTIALYNMNSADRVAELGRILLAEEYRSNGYMEEAIKVVVDWAFTQMRLWKLRVTAFMDNTAAIALYHKCGFESLKRPVMILEAKNHEEIK